MERRDLLKGLAAGIAGAVASPAPSTAHDHASAAATPQAAARDLPRLLDDHQRRTLTSLAELLVPGSVAAGAVELIDRVAAVDAQPRQRQLLNALAQFDRDARGAGAGRWLDLSETAKLEILRAAAAAKPPADHFLQLRTTVANTYYATEPGMRELGWTGRTAWKELPACTHPAPEHE
jgi:Gluconate 2-dehydrogenase subunit 3